MLAQPYLNFAGDCAEAFRLYADVLGGDIAFMQTFGESPMGPDTPPEHRDYVMHARLEAGDVVLLGSDAPPERYQRPQGVFVSLQVETIEDGERIFDALADGGSVMMPFAETFWAAGFGMLADRFGIPWMVNVDRPTEGSSA